MSQTSNIDQEKAKKAVSILLWVLTPINALYYKAGDDERLQRWAITGSTIINQPSPGTSVASLKFDGRAGNKD
jgi:hypothetical protein